VTTRVCVSIRESTSAGTIASLARAAEWADLVEVRADYVRDLDIHSILQAKTCPVIFTLRSREEGGEFQGSEKIRLEMIVQAFRAGADYVDVEFSASWQEVIEAVPRNQVVLSHHDYNATPQNLVPQIERMASAGAGIMKIATRARRLTDNLAIARALEYASSRRLNLCALAMGREGIPSRVLASKWNSWMTFASLLDGEPTAEGQIAAPDFVRQYRVHATGAATKIYGVLGKPLGHSLSPAIHNCAFAARGIDALYLPLEAADIEDFMEFQSAIPLHGVSVTIPYKEAVRSCLQSSSIEAEMIGAINTLIRTNDGWYGENTDVDGFLRPLQKRVDLRGLRVVVLGAGGAARSVIYGLTSHGASVCVVNRDSGKARHLAEAFHVDYADRNQLHSLRWDVLINATPVGMFPKVDESPVPAEWLTGEWVYDLVYNPLTTRLLGEASARGLGIVRGEEMFLSQAFRQQELWCGLPVPEKAMEEAFRSIMLRVETGTR
jgi:3-dehydroquinate dehydratase / shikimate dehydrogenase